MTDYEFKTQPFSHQRDVFASSRDLPIFAVLWEQGTGKSKLIVDTATYLFEAGKIDCLLIAAPNGVHRNWIEDEVPIHMPDRALREARLFFYQNDKSKTQWHKLECQKVLRTLGLAVVAVTYDSFRTAHGKRFIWSLLKKRRCLYVLDEHTDIKTPGAKTTISVVASGRYAPYKRIMDGTPVTVGPFDVYAPIRFLDEDFWKHHELGDFGAFKAHFGIYKVGKRAGGKTSESNPYDPGDLVGYRRLGELKRLLDPISSRVLKEDVLDLPPKLYSRLYHEMTPKQARLYKDLAEHYIAMLDDETVVAPLPIVQLLRLQQIVCGYVPTEESKGEDGEPERDVDTKNTRLDMATWYFNHMPHKCLVWARFRRDIDLIMHRLGNRAVRYDGAISDDQRAANKREFQRSDRVQFFVANPQAAARGLTLVEARSELYYSNSFKLRDRLQSEDRAHRAGQEHAVNITDLMCAGTVDTKIVSNLRKKFDVASQITGDKLRDWI